MSVLRIAAVVLAAAAWVAPAQAQGYPSKPVRFVTSEPGGGNDIVARVLAEGLTASLGQRVIVDNRGIVAAEIAKNQEP